MSTHLDERMFKMDGVELRLRIFHDADMQAPWIEHCGHGSVREAKARDEKRPGERTLYCDRHYYLFYDWEDAIRLAKKDGWGLCPERHQQLAREKGREPTKGEIIERAVWDDFCRLRDWCDDKWRWIWIEVEHLPSGISRTLGGIESDCEDYLTELCTELGESVLEEAMPRFEREMRRAVSK